MRVYFPGIIGALIATLIATDCPGDMSKGTIVRSPSATTRLPLAYTWIIV